MQSVRPSPVMLDVVTTSIRFFFIDVFADRPLTGNPLTLVPEADDLSVAQMQAIAREFNQSETTFLFHTDEEGVDWRLRSFTPAGVEVDGAGHNAIGAWLWLAEHGFTGRLPAVTMHQRIGADILAVEVLRAPGQLTRIVMDQGAPVFGSEVAGDERLAGALGLAPGQFASDASARVVSTGVAHLLVPLASRDAVDAAVADHRELAAVLADAGAEGCYLYTTDGEGAAAYTRFFNPTVGIAEDPATGTAAGPLAVSLIRSGSARSGEPVFIEQGHHLGRPSRIRVDVNGDRVQLSGSGLVTGQGELRLDMNPRDEELLAAAISLATAAAESGELPYGSLLADGDGTILASEHNTVASSHDITAHPELKLARLAAVTYPPSSGRRSPSTPVASRARCARRRLPAPGYAASCSP